MSVFRRHCASWLSRSPRPAFSGFRYFCTSNLRRQDEVPEDGSLPFKEANEWKKPDGIDTGILLSNSLHRIDKKLTRTPLIVPESKELKWYMCGPTVYDATHIGHAACYMKFDFVRRALRYIFGIKTRLVVNFTDVDDKIIIRSKALGIPVEELTKKYELDFLESLDALRIERADDYLRVTDHMPAIVEYIQELVRKGYAYHAVTGDINFDLAHFMTKHHTGKLQPNASTPHPAAVLSRGKRHPGDFTLWKCQPAGEVGWDFEWEGVGTVRGRPGWHIECSTLAKIAFGDHIDIHSGGGDLAFPHHENEIRQSEAYHGTDQWVDYFLHCGTLLIDGSKMSKSLGNAITVKELLQKHTPDHFRMLCMAESFKGDCEFTDASMDSAVMIYQTFFNFHSQVMAVLKGNKVYDIDVEAFAKRTQSLAGDVRSALKSNLNASKAIAVLFDFVNTFHEFGTDKPATGARPEPEVVDVLIAAYSAVRFHLLAFGFEVSFMKDAVAHAAGLSGSQSSSDSFSEAIDGFVAFRNTIRCLSLATGDQQLEGLMKLLRDHYGDSKTDKQILKEYRKITAPYMTACDGVRLSSKQKGVDISDYRDASSWEHLTRDVAIGVLKKAEKKAPSPGKE